MNLFSKPNKVELEAAEVMKQKVILYKQVFSTQQGKEVLYDLINASNVLTTHKGDAYLEGRRSIVLEILNLVHIKPEQFNEMLGGTT